MILSNCWVLFLRLGFNNLLQCMEKTWAFSARGVSSNSCGDYPKRQKAQQAENLEELFSPSSPPLPKAFCNLLLRLPKQGFLLPSRHEYNFQKIHNQRLELRRLKQTYENENPVYYQNELQHISNDTSERSRHLGAASVCDLRPLEDFPLFISDY